METCSFWTESNFLEVNHHTLSPKQTLVWQTWMAPRNHWILPTKPINNDTELPEIKSSICFFNVTIIIALCLRILPQNRRKYNELISVEEVDKAEIRVLKLKQATSFLSEIVHITNAKYGVFDRWQQICRVINNCKPCYRFNAKTVPHKMVDLPDVRVKKARASLNVGIDFCGLFSIKEKKFRNRIKIKLYVCVFICMCIKVVHLEIVSDLTTDGFLAAFSPIDFSRQCLSW